MQLRALLTVYPRVGGGTGKSSAPALPNIGLSPRGRGNPTHQGMLSTKGRSIPAWAGEPSHSLLLQPVDPVYPRVGGGASWGMLKKAWVTGLSPRGRGNQ